MLKRWAFAWAWFIGAVIAAGCNGLHIPPVPIPTPPPTPPPQVCPAAPGPWCTAAVAENCWSTPTATEIEWIGPCAEPAVPPVKVCNPGETCGCYHRPPGQRWQQLPGCVEPPPAACVKEADLVAATCAGETWGDAVFTATEKLGFLGTDCNANLKALAAELVATHPDKCIIAGQEAIFAARSGGLFEENHSCLFGKGTWTNSGRGKFMGCHKDKTAPAPPPAVTCGPPTPPPAWAFKVKPHQAFCVTHDSTVLVKGAAYCAAVGFTDGRSICAVRGEGAADRAACEALVIGGAQKWGCAGGCEVYPCAVAGNCVCGGTENKNPSQAVVIGHGTVTTCTADGKVCGSLVIP